MSSSRREFMKKSALLTTMGFLAACEKTGISSFAGFEICQNICIGCGDCSHPVAMMPSDQKRKELFL